MNDNKSEVEKNEDKIIDDFMEDDLTVTYNPYAFLLEDENILEVEEALVDHKGIEEPGISIVVGDMEQDNGYEIVLTLSELKKVVKLLEEEND